jgi:hypothetical protein
LISQAMLAIPTLNTIKKILNFFTIEDVFILFDLVY